MESFERRKDGFERKFAHDEELKFKAMARRNRLLGHWAAEKLGLTGADADAYARDVVKADFQEPGDEDVLREGMCCQRQQEERCQGVFHVN